ncbi:MAG: family 78 glycoside hydrolase catalytic domain, partial [Clostridia bacterium]|nr:family 78 glycoside hydrolase catalytic domain [Clostridia bacterium]
MIKKAMWITPDRDFGEICPSFIKKINVKKGLEKAEISVTANGVYEGFIDGKRIGKFFMAPGWTNYEKRLQYQTYDITGLLSEGESELVFTVGNGWYRGKIVRQKKSRIDTTPNLLAMITLDYGTEKEYIPTDLSWTSKQSKILFSDIYDGEIYDANFEGECAGVRRASANKSVVIPQEGEIVCEHERFSPVSEFITPKGERVIDFGQEITGYPEIKTIAKKGEEVCLSFAEMMEKDGNFYNENYRESKCIYRYICKDGEQTYKPHTTFYGFRYIRVDSAPENTEFTAVVVHSDLKRTGYLLTENKKVQRLFDNIIWGQKGNFLDVPTDCPQRNERLGWTGDAEVFVKTAAYQFDVKRFFNKWLSDMKSEQRADGHIPNTVPDALFCGSVNANSTSPAWGDAATVCPWALYEIYRDKEMLGKFFPMMCGWVSYIENNTDDENLWTGHGGFADWLGLDAEEGSYKGKSRLDFIASAYYKYSSYLLEQAAEVLGLDILPYKERTNKARKAFIERFPTCETQTEYALALHFDLTDKKDEFAGALDKMIKDNGNRLTTGFVGTPYLLFALSENGYTDTAYSLLLQNKFPSWLYSVEQGATTIWEHW